MSSASPGLLDTLDRLARERGDAPAVADRRRALTFAALADESRRLAAWLGERGLGLGDRVAVLLENRVELLAALGACWRLGAVPAVLGAGPPATVARALAACAPRAMLRSRLSRRVAATAAVDLGLDVDDEADAGASIHPYAEVRGHAELRAAAPPPEAADAVLLYTSGSTGEPKGARLSHAALSGNAELVRDYLGLGADRDSTSVFLPLSTRMGLTALLGHLCAGASTALDEGLFTEHGFALVSPRAPRLSGFSATPAHLALLLDRGLLTPAHLPGLRYLRVGAGPLDRGAVARLRALHPTVEVLATYGLTETGEVTVLAGEAITAQPESIGAPCADVQVTIVGDDGQPVRDGEVGEIAVAGPRCLSGYLGGTASALDELGRYRTGDLGARDAGGHFMLVGRIKDLIKVAGVSVQLDALAAALARVAGVREVVAVGTPDRLLGEAAHVFVVAQSAGTLDVLAVRRACAALLPPAAMPKGIHVVEELPRLASGKVDRQALIDRAAQARPAAGSRQP